jgi:hydrogenase/urease accessory protein HupE
MQEHQSELPARYMYFMFVVCSLITLSVAVTLADPVKFSIGFVISTIGLHVMGALIGLIVLRSSKDILQLQRIGSVIGIFGCILFEKEII